MKQFENNFSGYLAALDVLRANGEDVNVPQAEAVEKANAILQNQGATIRVEPEPDKEPTRPLISKKKK